MIAALLLSLALGADAQEEFDNMDAQTRKKVYFYWMRAKGGGTEPQEKARPEYYTAKKFGVEEDTVRLVVKEAVTGAKSKAKGIREKQSEMRRAADEKNAVVAKQAKADREETIAKADKRAVEVADRVIAYHAQNIESTKAQILRLRKSPSTNAFTSSGRPASEENIERLQGELKRLRDGAFKWPRMPDDLRVGAMGQVTYNFIAQQVIGPDVLLCTLGDEFVFVEGINTTGMTNGNRFSIDDLMTVKGTRTYRTVLGASKTVFVLEVLPYMDDVRAVLEARRNEFRKG